MARSPGRRPRPGDRVRDVPGRHPEDWAEDEERQQYDLQGYADVMPMPKRSSVADFFAQLNDVQRRTSRRSGS